jgi:hypothetical protein
VVLITLHSSVDITRFLYKNESYIVKEGVRTTTIRPEGKKEKLVKITGLHPNTKDQAVIKYLTAHATVSPNAKVIHHVFPGEPGSSLLAGKLNGNRSYMVELKVPMMVRRCLSGTQDRSGLVPGATSTRETAQGLLLPRTALLTGSCCPLT